MKKTNNLLTYVVLTILISCNTAFSPLKAQEDSVDVWHYGINLDIDNRIAKTHIGYVDIGFNILNPNPSGNISFSLKGQFVDSIELNVAYKTSPYKISSYIYDGKKINISLADSLLEFWRTDFSTPYLRIYYHGSSTVENNSSQWGGMHYDYDIIYTMGVAFGDYPHSYARSWFPVHENFTDKAKYDLNITTQSSKKAVCSGEFIGVVDKGSSKIWHYTVGQDISPYLVAITIADFHTIKDNIYSDLQQKNIPFEINYVHPSDSAILVYNLSGVKKAFNKLEKSFGKFRFNRVGYTLTPKGSMEHVDNISLSSGTIEDTNIEDVSNPIHELGHSWFGNLLTTEAEEDMWLNEGWTSYTTRLTLDSIFGNERAKAYWRGKQESVLKTVPRSEGYISVSGVDSTLTYSSTVYDKGAMIAWTIQSMFYENEENFYDIMTHYLDSLEYKNHNSIGLKNYLSSHYSNPMLMNSVLDMLVFSPSNFNVDIAIDGNNVIKRYDAYPHYENIPPVPVLVTMMDTNFNRETHFAENIHNVNGRTCFVDLGENQMFLKNSNNMVLSSTGLFKFGNTYSRLKINSISDSIFVQSTLHYLGAENENIPNGVNRISSQHYWTIAGVNMQKADMTLQLYAELSSNRTSFDSTLVSGYDDKDSLILLYRKDFTKDWIMVPMEDFDNNKGYISTSFVQNGDYTFAVGDKNIIGLNDIKADDTDIKIFPNPTSGKVTIRSSLNKNLKVDIFDMKGKKVKSFFTNNKDTVFYLHNTGSYIVIASYKDNITSKILVLK